LSSFLFSPAAFSQPNPVLVGAASDLAPLEQPLIQLGKSSGISIRFVFSSSGQLANQIQNGAPYDVYLSANKDLVDSIAKSGDLRPESVTIYAAGRLALWSKTGKIKQLNDLSATTVRHVALANPAHAPYGQAAKSMLERSGLWTGLEKKAVYGENVRQALQFAESGNAEAALVAWSLVKDRGGILLPNDKHPPIIQAGGVVARSKQQEAAGRFLKLLVSPEGQRLFQQAGFDKPSQ